MDSGIDTKKALDGVLEHFSESKKVLLSLFPTWLRYYQLFRSWQQPKSRPWRAQVFVPIPFASTMHGLAMLMEAWWTQPFIRVFPRRGTVYNAAKAAEGYLDWEMYDMTGFLPLYGGNQDMLLYGNGWMKPYWDWIADRNTIESVSPFNIFPDPSAEGVDDADYVIHRALRSKAYCLRMAKEGLWDISEDEVEKLALGGLQYREQGDDLLTQIGGPSLLYKNRLEVLEDWVGDGVPTTILNRAKVVRAKKEPVFPHKRKPFVQLADHALAHEMFGIGELEIIEKLCEELNDYRNQWLDISSLKINNVLIASTMAGIKPESLVMKPGGIIWATTTDAVKPLVQGGEPALGVQHEQLIRFDIENATGNHGYSQGQTPSRRETATTVLALQRASGTRFTLKIRWNEEAAIRRMARMMLRNAQEFMPPVRWVRITGQQMPVELHRDQIQGDYDFVPAASSAEPREAKRAQLAQILPLLLQHPRLDDQGFMDVLFDLFGLSKEKEKVIMSDEKMLQRLQMMAPFKQQGQGGVASPDMGVGGMGSLPPLEGIAGASAPNPELVNQLLGGGG